MSDVPIPTETGSTGEQKQPEGTLVVVQPVSPLSGLPLVKTVEGLAATKFRAMGGEVVAGLMAGSMSQLAQELEQTRKDLSETHSALDAAKDDIAKAQQEAAVLQERIRGYEKSRNLKNFGIAAGTLLLSIGIDLWRNNLVTLAILIGIVGIVFVGLSWTSSGTEEARK